MSWLHCSVTKDLKIKHWDFIDKFAFERTFKLIMSAKILCILAYTNSCKKVCVSPEVTRIIIILKLIP